MCNKEIWDEIIRIFHHGWEDLKEDNIFTQKGESNWETLKTTFDIMAKKQADTILGTFLEGCDTPHDEPCIEKYDSVDFGKYLKLLEEALQKQTPEKPLKVEDCLCLCGELICKCPRCERITSYERMPTDTSYCKWCGQKLDWVGYEQDHSKEDDAVLSEAIANRLIPKEPIRLVNYTFGEVAYECPTCGGELGPNGEGRDNPYYCQWCGQKLDWSYGKDE